MADISMTYASMEEASKKITSAKEELEQAKKAIDSAVSTLSGGYVGQGYEAFHSAWQESAPKVQNMIDAISRFSPALDEAKERQRETEEANKGKFSSLGL